jgi:predicted ATP-dependent endonuclease of OLD family
LQASGLGIKDFGVYQIENTKELSPKDSSRLSKLVHINMFDKPAIVGVVIENDNGRCDDLDYYGSSGAKKMFVLAVLISNALANGQVLFIDEMDSGLHPNLASKILEMFDDPKKNPKGSQLIFTTHNTNHLERMDQDQVWLVEKKYDHSSELFPLSDFIIRHNENVMQSYLLGNYGGCP